MFKSAGAQPFKPLGKSGDILSGEDIFAQADGEVWVTGFLKSAQEGTDVKLAFAAVAEQAGEFERIEPAAHGGFDQAGQNAESAKGGIDLAAKITGGQELYIRAAEQRGVRCILAKGGVEHDPSFGGGFDHIGGETVAVGKADAVE